MNRILWLLGYLFLALTVMVLGGYLAVSLVVERSPEITVPDVSGRGLSEALDTLNEVGLDLEVRAFVYSDDVPENHVVRQRPDPGAVVKGGRGIGLVLSRGAERHAVPDVRRKPLADARIALEEHALKAAVGGTWRGPPEGEVIGQAVDPGRRLPRGSEVPLLVSAGPRALQYRMPGLAGLPLESALVELDELGLRAARIEEVELEDPTVQGRLVAQDPLPGFPVARGDAVVLTVGRSGGPLGRSHGIWVRHALRPGFARHRVRLVLESGGHTWELADDWVPGGQVFRRWVSIRAGDRLRLWVNAQEQPVPLR